jgi:hypothetical protein
VVQKKQCMCEEGIMKRNSIILLAISVVILFVLLAACNLSAKTDGQESAGQDVAPSATPTTVVEEVPADGAQEGPAAPPEEAPTATPLPTATPEPSPTPNLVRVSYDLFAGDLLGPDIEQFPEDVNPMTAMRVSDTEMLGLPPLMVSITNSPATARPQAGLSDAPHVYEFFIGQGTTRFLAVFYGVQPREELVLTGNLPVREGAFDQFGLIAGNQVWFDENEDGIQDVDEWGIGGVGVSLLDGNSGRLLDSTTTNSNGYFGFNVYPGSNYRMLFLLPGGYKFSPQHQGADLTLDSEADPETGLTDVFVTYHNDISLDTGMLLTQPFRHLPEGNPPAPQPVDYAGNGKSFLAKLEEGKIDTTDLNQYTKLLAIMKGLTDEVEAAADLNLPQPSGEQAELMQSLLDAWDVAVASQLVEIKANAPVLAADLHRGNLNQLGNARIMMMVLGGIDSSTQESVEVGPFRILPTGENQAVMQELVDAAREGAGNLALTLAERLYAGDLDAYSEAVRLMLFLREKSYLAEEDLGGILGVVPFGENARAMQEMEYAARVGADVHADDIISRLEQDDQQAIRDGRILMLMLTEGAETELDDYGLPPAVGENTETMQRLGDAIRAALNAQLQTSRPQGISLKARSGTGELMALAQSAHTQEEPDPCVTRVDLPGAFLGYDSSDRMVMGLPTGEMTAETIIDIDDSVVIKVVQNGQEVTSFDAPPGTTIEGGTNIIFPKGTTALEDKAGVIYIADPGCQRAFAPQPFFDGWRLIGPTRSGRIYMTQFIHLYTGGCVVYAHKDPTVPVSGCQIIVENYNPEDVNAAGFDPEKLKPTAAGNAPPGFIPNYSGNLFFGNSPFQPGSGWFFGSAVDDSRGVMARPVQEISGQPAKDILVFYSVLNQAYWEYDPLTGTYLRYEDLADPDHVGEFIPSVDRFTGRQVSFSNVVVLFAHHEVVKTNVINAMIEGNRGTGKLFRNGQAFDIIWTTLNTEYEYETQQLRPPRIEDLDGNPFPLAPGQTWFHVVPDISQVWEVEPGQWKVRSYDPPGT